MVVLVVDPGGRSFDPDSSGRSARIPPGKTVFSLLDRKKSRRAKVTAGKAVELETFHSAMSSQYYTSASESTDRPLIEDLDRADTLRRSGIWTQQASVFEQTTHPSFDSSRNSSGSSSSVRKSAGSRDMSSYVDSTTNLKYAPPGQSLAVVIEPRRQSLPESSSPDPYGFGVLSGQLEGSQDLDADVKRHPRTTTRFKELEAMEPDEDFAEELLEMKKRMNRPARV
ncbi:hypothetical protein BSKO_03066 [Bryopsis sp. KO-2023]|nr:hypothetical protein BSKO_03066 [Bryopsis sp. KO-2023]